MQKKAYFHSPFSEKTVLNENNPSLLLLFILTELLLFMNSSELLSQAPPHLPKNHPSFLLSVFQDNHPLNRIQEHSTLLTIAFPFKKKEAFLFSQVLCYLRTLLCAWHEKINKNKEKTNAFKKKITEQLNQLFFLLEPFLQECKNKVNLLFFLLNHHKDISLLMQEPYLPILLKKLHPEGMHSMQKHMCDYFHEKGLAYLIPKTKLLLEIISKNND